MPTELDLDQRFQRAVSFIQNLPPVGPYQPSHEERLQYYALYKQATIGACNQPKPAFYDIFGKQKWEAWTKLGAMPKDDAKRLYLKTIFASAQVAPPSALLNDFNSQFNANANITSTNHSPSSNQITPVAAAAVNGYNNNNNTSTSQATTRIHQQTSASIKIPTPAVKSAAAATATTKQQQPIILYGNHASQPSRAVYWFCVLNNIPVEFRLVKILNGDHLSKSFSAMNPNRKVPVINDNGFFVFESHAILRYLAGRFADRVNSHWYPSSDLEARTRIDMYLDWHHTNLRKGALLVYSKYVAPLLKLQITKEQIEQAKKDLRRSLKILDGHFLNRSKQQTGDSNNSTAFIGGSENASIADLIAFCELNQIVILLDYDLTEFPNVSQWYKAMCSLKFFESTHQLLFRMKEKSQQKQQQKPMSRL